MGCGDVAFPIPRRNDSDRDVQLDDISVSGFGEMAKSTNAAVAQYMINPRYFYMGYIIITINFFK
jgi:hypothetical protein